MNDENDGSYASSGNDEGADYGACPGHHATGKTK